MFQKKHYLGLNKMHVHMIIFYSLLQWLATLLQAGFTVITLMNDMN